MAHKSDDGASSAGSGPVKMSFADLAGVVDIHLPPSRWFCLDQPLVSQFAAATDDAQWIHIDPARTEAELGHGTIVHGFLTLSLVVAMSRDILEVLDAGKWINYGLNKVRFLTPVPVGARIRLHQDIVAAERRGDAFMLTRKCSVEMEGEEKPAMVAEWIDLIHPPAVQAGDVDVRDPQLLQSALA